MKTVLGALLVCLTVAGVSACDNMTTRQRDTAMVPPAIALLAHC
jgi:hypothetical protein